MDDALHKAEIGASEDDSDSWNGRAILHVDMDAFFASVEQLDHPEWRGKPLIVGGRPGERGVVATASYEARRFGVRSAMPSAQAERLCPDAIWTHGRFDRYRELSATVCAILREMTPIVEQVSIDEAYLDVTPSRNRPEHPVDIALAIRDRVDALGLSCSIGVATARCVAKIASDFDKPHGITVVPPGAEARFLAPMPVTALGGIGSATAERLREAGIRTLGDLAALDEQSARSLLGSTGPELARRAAGIDDRPVGVEREVKSISNEHTFSTDIRERSDVEAALRTLVARVAGRLRAKSLKGRTLTLKLRYGDFTTKTVSRTLAEPVNLESDLMPTALALLASAWTAGAGIRLLGFGVSGFGQATEQLDLFGQEVDANRSKTRALTEGLDAIRSRFGTRAILHGTELLDAKARDEGEGDSPDADS